MIVMPIVYVSDLARSRAFYEQLGFFGAPSQRGADWAELTSAGGILALHQVDPLPRDYRARVELVLVATTPLSELVDGFSERGVDVEIFSDEAGPFITLIDPDGLPLRVNAGDEDR